MCKDCLHRLLEVNYFRELLLEANKTFAHLVPLVSRNEEIEREAKKITKTEKVSPSITEETVLETEDVPEASEEQEVEVLTPEFDTNEVFKVEQSEQESEQDYEGLQLLEYSCCMCTYIFSTEDALRFHCQTDHTIQILNTEPDENQCRLCCSHFGSVEDLCNHKTCDNCFDCFASNEDLHEHLKTHEFDPLEVQAVEVARQLEQETLHVSYDRKRPRSKKPSNNLLKPKFIRADVNNLPRVANTFSCCLCPTSLDSEKARSRHMLDTHQIRCGTEFELKRMTCVYCNRQFERMDQYYAHFEIPIRKKNRCTKCGRNFLSPELLAQHEINIHLSDTPSYYCQACKMQFATANAYYSHNHRHHTSKPRYKCDICGDMLITPSKLKEHRNVHLNIKNFVCNVCNKTFIRKDNLRNHLRTHTGDKPYSCEYCHKTFGHYTDMKRHRYIHTGEYPFKCEDCGKGFVKQAALTTHMKFHKGKPHVDRTKLRNPEIIIRPDSPDNTDNMIRENKGMNMKIIVLNEGTETAEADNEA